MKLPLTVSLGFSVFEAELADHIPVVKTSVAGTRLVGRVTVGMPACMRLSVLILLTRLCLAILYVSLVCRQQEWFIDAKHDNGPRYTFQS